ncbi:hypothetical protein K488DRAFT_82598 [Vararia minispora EC-137]|uniref:Uncharacterized protein n=1 Tax=Vararia minispora EC-137 TaxID=1314806 RepID=A0ACB8QWF2_9AGAM|nr:hypothetical protein K488DRAFT_82598 [Vararia minispora EC-137]
MAVGYTLMKTTVPTPEQTYREMAPDLRAKVDANRRARLAAEELEKQQSKYVVKDADEAKPVWAEKR